MLPNKNQIIEKAIELWKQDRLRNGNMEAIDKNPEVEELAEEGFLVAAQQELMRSEGSEYKTWLEKEYNEVIGKQQNLTQVSTYPCQTEQAIPFDLNVAMASGVSLLGGRHCGKSTLAMALTDIIKTRAIIYVIDPSMVWQRRRRDMQMFTIPIPTKHEVTLSWQYRNTIFDTSRLNPEQQRDFTEIFAKVTMQAQIGLPEQTRPQVWLWLEEAHNSLPLWIFHSKRMPELKRLITVGANFNVSFGLITQFAAEVSKLPVKATQQRYFGLTSEPNDIRYIRNFIGKEPAEQLKTLDVGEFFYCYRNTLTKFRTVAPERNLNSVADQTVFNYAIAYGGS